MSLRTNNTEITSVQFNGTEIKAVRLNNAGYFGKRYTLAENSSTGVSLSVSRTSSPNQQAGTGSVGTGNTIYYGDTLTIGVSANAGYTNPKLYVDVGDGSGMLLRSSPFSFAVSNNVTFYGSASYVEDWKTVWTGSRSFTASGSFAVPGLASGGSVQISASVEFLLYEYDPYSDNENVYPSTQNVNNSTLPKTVYSDYASVYIKRSDNLISFDFNAFEEEFKGVVTRDTPIRITFTSVRRKA